MKKVVIVGGGLSGLATGYTVLEQAKQLGEKIELLILEEEDYLGGKCKTQHTEGFIVEGGPNGFLDNKPSTLALCDKLGIRNLLLRSNDAAAKRFVFSDGRLHQLPESPVSFMMSNLLSIRGRLRIVGEFFVPKGSADKDETLAEFVKRRLGQEALDKLIDPMASGIYAGDPNVLSVKSCFAKVVALEQKYGGLIKGMLKMQLEAKAAGKSGPQSAGPGGVLMSFGGGVKDLIDSIAKAVGTEKMKTSKSVKHLKKNTTSKPNQKAFTVQLDDGSMEADAVILATPAYDAANILQNVDSSMSEILNDIPYVAAAMVCFGYPREKMSHPLDGFGYLIPNIEKRRILGSLWSSSIFPNRAPKDHVLMQSIVGGARHPEYVDLDEKETIQMVFEELKITMGIENKPTFARVFPWKKAIPAYTLGHDIKLSKLDEKLKNHDGLFLTGNAYRGIGINDCTNDANRTADLFADYLKKQK